MRTLLSLILVFLTSLSFYAQKEKNIWYFGNKAGLDFSTIPPTSINNGQTIPSAGVIEGTAVACDSTSGALLFYTDGVTVWNKNHQVMTNGTGLAGDFSSTQSALIVPMPGNKNRYYIFTTPGFCGTMQFNGPATYFPEIGATGVYACYSVVDLSQNGGLGSVITKNTRMPQLMAPEEKLTAIPHCNGKDWWVILRHHSTNEFYVYPLTSTGIGNPIISAVGLASTPKKPFNGTIGQLKASPNGTKIAIATNMDPGSMQLFDFCRSDGKISNPVVDQNFPSTVFPYGVSFSSDNKKLYLTTTVQGATNLANSFLYQYDISSGNATTITSSKTLIATATTGVTGRLHSLQLGTDNKIYLARETGKLDVINSPNSLGAGCNYVANAIDISPNYAVFGLPNFIDANIKNNSKSVVDLGPDIVQCSGNVTLDAGAFTTIACANSVTYSWSNGATTQTTTVSQSGQYIVKVTNCNDYYDTINVTIGSLKIQLPNDTTLCASQLTLNPGTVSGASYLWSTGATTQIITATNSGKYVVSVTANGCTSKDSTTITFGSLAIDLGKDTSLCSANPFAIDAGISGATYLWNTGATTQSINVNSTGTYSVQVDKGGCKATDLINVTIGSLTLNLGNDTTFCSGSITLNAQYNGGTFLWNTGATTQTITVNSPGTYSVNVDFNGCKTSDVMQVNAGSINVSLGNDTTLCGGQKILNATTNGATYLWNTGATTPTITATTSGNYSVTVTQGTCTATDNISVTFNTNLNVNLGNDTTFCSGAVILDAKNPGADYVWSTGASTQTISVSSSGTYWVKTFKNNCWITDTIKILTATPVDPLNDVTICESVDITLDAQNPGASYLWSTGSTDQIINVMDTGMYWVRISFGSCKINDTANVTSNEGSPSIFVPNAFTPNNNNLNEKFIPATNDITEYELSIFNRWGELIFKTKDQNQGWDGKINGRLAQQDVYVWIIDYTVNCPDTRNKRKVGHVSLLR